jgi:hypothetical protein
MKRIRVPGDKSITHRAFILAAVCTGRSRIRGHLLSADTQSTATVLRQLGCPIPLLESDAELVVDGVGLHGLTAPAEALDCGNSGTTARLLMGVLAGSDFMPSSRAMPPSAPAPCAGSPTRSGSWASSSPTWSSRHGFPSGCAAGGSTGSTT